MQPVIGWSTKRDAYATKDPIPQIVEFVDDDDDFNALPEWQRPRFRAPRGQYRALAQLERYRLAGI